MTSSAQEVFAEDAVVANLNGLNFPEEYVFGKPMDFTKITGLKKFTGNVTAEEMSIQYYMNGINLDKVVTLTGDQTILGNITFNDLEITEAFNVRFFELFLQKKTL